MLEDRTQINKDEIYIKPLEVIMAELTVPSQLETIPLPEKPGIEIGIKETLDAVDFSIALANSIVIAYQDGQLGLTDFQYAISPFMKVPAMLSGINAIPAEISDMTEAELQQIVDKVSNDLEVNSDKALVIVTKAIKVAYSIYELLKLFKD